MNLGSERIDDGVAVAIRVTLGLLIGVALFSVVAIVSGSVISWASGAVSLPNGRLLVIVPFNFAWVPGVVLVVVGIVAAIIFQRASNVVLVTTSIVFGALTLVGLFAAAPVEPKPFSFTDMPAGLLVLGASSPASWLFIGMAVARIITKAAPSERPSADSREPTEVGGGD